MLKRKVTPKKLIKAAQDLLKKRYQKDGHHFVVAAALLTESGNVYAALHSLDLVHILALQKGIL